MSKQLHVSEPLVTDSSGTGTAILGLSTLDSTGEIVDAFDEQGNYIRQIHVNGELISAELFNKWETALETNSANISTLSTQVEDIANEIGTETLNTTAQDLKGAINEVFQSASNGKLAIVTALTGKGINASNTDTFEELAQKITQISTGITSVDGLVIKMEGIKYVLSEDADGNVTATKVKHSRFNE